MLRNNCHCYFCCCCCLLVWPISIKIYPNRH